MELAARLQAAAARFVPMVSIIALLSLPTSSLLAQSATPVDIPTVSSSSNLLTPAWLQLGPDGVLLAKVIVAGNCPSLNLDGRTSEMRSRTSPSDDFPVVACEAAVPFGVRSAEIAGQLLPLPMPPFERIAVVGDTGCRLSDWEKKYQDCNDPAAWPFAQVAASVAAWQPDLIIHVGDFLYRESACPTNMTGCAGSPFGDNWPTWNADFFAPASPLLAAAPLVIMRGNHETCSRNPEGWFHYLDPRPYQAACQQFTDPYVVPLVGMALAVIDSAEASDTTDSPDEVTAYREQFTALAEMAPADAWLVTHRPMWGILEGKSGEIQVDNASYQAATDGNLKAEYGLILSGHIHLAQSLSFAESSGRPPQVIAGNSGTTLDSVPSASPTAQELGDAAIQDAENLEAFGFMTLEPDGGTWVATQRDPTGAPLINCELALPEISCTDDVDEKRQEQNDTGATPST